VPGYRRVGELGECGTPAQQCTGEGQARDGLENLGQGASGRGPPPPLSDDMEAGHASGRGQIPEQIGALLALERNRLKPRATVERQQRPHHRHAQGALGVIEHG